MKYDLYYAIDEHELDGDICGCAMLDCMEAGRWVWVVEEECIDDEPCIFKGMFVCSTHLEQVKAEAKASRDFMEATR